MKHLQAPAILLALALSGCAATEGLWPAPTSHDPMPKMAERESDKLIKLPAAPEDLVCPDVDIFEGGATARVGGEASTSVRYQFSIRDISRECAPQGNQFALKIGVAGHLLIGPAGAPGAYGTSLKVEVKRDLDDKVVFAKTYRIQADTKGDARAPYSFVSDPIVLPLTRARLDQDYSVLIGLGGSTQAPKTRHRHKR